MAIVPMRGGSKGLVGKNLRVLAGSPLYAHAINTAIAAGAARVLISTDIKPVLAAEHPRSVSAIHRPAHLSTDDATMSDVLLHVLDPKTGLDIDEWTTIVLLQPTSPLRSVGDVHATVARLEQSDIDLAMTVVEADKGALKYGAVVDGRFEPLAEPSYCFANRQTLPEVYRPNGAVYAFKAGWFLKNGGFVTERIGAVQMPAERSVDVDCIQDFDRAAGLLLLRNREGAA